MSGVVISNEPEYEVVKFGETEFDVRKMTAGDIDDCSRRATRKGRLDHDLLDRLLVAKYVRGWRRLLAKDGSAVEFPADVTDADPAKREPALLRLHAVIRALPVRVSRAINAAAYGDHDEEVEALGNSGSSSGNG